MGSRSRSIRLRIYFLVAIPLVAMVGLLAYVAGTSVSNAIDLDRAPNLINKTSLPTADFVKYLQAERAAAVIYLFAPTPANLAAYDTAVANTSQNSKAFRAAMTSPATVRSETPSETHRTQCRHVTGFGGIDDGDHAKPFRTCRRRGHRGTEHTQYRARRQCAHGVDPRVGRTGDDISVRARRFAFQDLFQHPRHGESLVEIALDGDRSA